MAIEIKVRPFVFNFSGNPVHYRLFSASAEADPDIYFEVRIQFKHTGDVFAPVVTLPCYPTKGFASVNIQDVLDSMLEYQLPAFDADETLITAAPKQSGYFYLEFREITVESTDPTWDISESEFIRGVLKAGLSYFKYRNNNFWDNYWSIDDVYKFMTWQQSRRLANINERMYLALLNGFDEDTNDLQVVATVYYNDGTNDNSDVTYAGSQRGIIYYIPSGCVQWGLHLLNPDKKIMYWTIEVRVGGSAYTEVFRYTTDNRNNYNDHTLHYRGSLGGIDSVRVRGVIEHNLNYANSLQDKTFEPDYYSGDEISPQQIVANNKELKVWKGDIGYLSKEEQDRLRDAQVQRECWWERSKKWWPVAITTGNTKQKTSVDQLWQFPIEFKLAHSGDHYYTPDNIDLGDSAFTANVCQAIPSNIIVTKKFDLDPDNCQVTINLEEVDPQDASTEYTYFIEGITPAPVTTTYGALPLVLMLPKEAIYTIELRSICTGGIQGKKVTQLIDTHTPEDPGGPGPDGNSMIINSTNSSGNFMVQINFGVFAEGNVGAHNNTVFNIADDWASVLVQVSIDSFRPSTATLTSNHVSYTGLIAIAGAGCVLSFEPVNIVGGFTITMS